MDIIKHLQQHFEGRKLEFKEEMPSHADLAKTVVSFANDAGGDIYIGISNDKTVVGVPEEELPAIEEQISNIIYNRCYPMILPEISYLSVADKHLIKVHIYKGSTPPYYLKKEGKMAGTYVRVGSQNRVADESILADLERMRMRVSFDAELQYEKTAEQLDIESFKLLYQEKTGELLTPMVLQKLDLVKQDRGILYPTNALLLLSDDDLSKQVYPNAQIQCARFKGCVADYFIDQKTISGNIALQAEGAYQFVLRHINKSAVVKGVYTVSRWEYPIKAIREVIRNAVVHRQYSLTGKDIKVAIYDDMVEITSPGLLPPTIDYADMNSRQSDARNKLIATVFKKIGIIDQWGNGLKLVAESMKEYPEISFRWKEVGYSFQVQFVKVVENKAFLSDSADDAYGLLASVDKTDTTGGIVAGYGGNEALVQSLCELIRSNAALNVQEMADALQVSKRTLERLMAQLKQQGVIRRVGSARSGFWQVV